MFTAAGGPGVVHSYFSPYGTPTDAFVTLEAALLDFEAKVRDFVHAANEPFHFHTATGDQDFTGISTWSLLGFAKALPLAPGESLEYHDSKGDFEHWAKSSLLDFELSQQFMKIRLSRVVGDDLRHALTAVVQSKIFQAEPARI